MIVYSETKGQFNKDVVNNLISDKILTKLREKGINGGSDAEFNSWQNSLKFMSNVLTDGDISDDVSVAIEYQIPRTSKRVDFIIAGSNNNENDNVVIVELKQWEKAEKVTMRCYIVLEPMWVVIIDLSHIHHIKHMHIHYLSRTLVKQYKIKI